MNRTISAFVAATVLGTGAALIANVNGGIQTTVGDGTTVNANIYDAKTDVYLNGGPQNRSDAGIRPDGRYYFQVTDPSGKVLLSTDPIECRQLVVDAEGRVAGVPADVACAHAVGSLNEMNGTTPVQLFPYLDTPNRGGEYKAWITPVDRYVAGDATACRGSANCWGFVESESKTDNFKVKRDNTAELTVCKFNDEDSDGVKGAGESYIAGWPITATGVGEQPITLATGQNGCVTFTYSHFNNSANASQHVTLTEDTTNRDWTQTAPASGTYAIDANFPEAGAFEVAGGVVSVDLVPGDRLHAPDFGNHKGQQVTLSKLIVTKDAHPGFNRRYGWTIDKSVDATTKSTASTAEFNYSVTVAHGDAIDDDFTVNGTITVSNPNSAAIEHVNVTDGVDNGGTCRLIDSGTDLTIAGNDSVKIRYECTYAALPPAGTNTAVATVAGLCAADACSGSAAIDFADAAVKVFNDSITVDDSLQGTLGTVTLADANPLEFRYARSFAGVAGTCTSYDNVATIRETGATDAQRVSVCKGAPLSVSKTATAAFISAIDKAVVGAKLVQQPNGSATFNYTVTVTTSGWTVSGAIDVVNPNDWQDVDVAISDLIDNGGACTVAGGTSVPRSGSLTATYTCTFTSAPAANGGTNTAKVSWDAAATFTGTGSASGTAGYAFGSVTVTDAFNGGTATTIGTVPGNAAATIFKYSQSVNNAIGGSCATYSNTAAIVGGASDTESVTICNTAAGGLTMGFWQNKNGQAIIKAANQVALGAYLDSFNPFKDRGTTVAATYITNVIKSANASGASMNAMLKGQMLATTLDVYFSDVALGGNMIGAPQAIGGVKIDLANVCADLSCTAYENSGAVFGGAAKTVAEMLFAASSQSNIGGSLWYGNAKFTQELAKDAFDAINNKLAWIAP